VSLGSTGKGQWDLKIGNIMRSHRKNNAYDTSVSEPFATQKTDAELSNFSNEELQNLLLHKFGFFDLRVADFNRQTVLAILRIF
jgi:hypothetical protein